MKLKPRPIDPNSKDFNLSYFDVLFRLASFGRPI
jgi:hypothetical protein